MKTALDHASDLLELGLCPIPVPFREKGPVYKGWQGLKLTADDLPKHFGDSPSNVGVLLGAIANWIVDIDLDHPLAVALAPEFLPPTGMSWGRAGKRKSHWIYHVTSPCDTRKWKNRAGSIAELRSTGAQTIAPGSVHPNGEDIIWESDGTPADIDPDILCEALEKLAAKVNEEYRKDAYVSEALRQETQAVARCPEGSRNDQLNRSAFALGTLVGAGVLTQQEAADALLEAAATCGLDYGESHRTVASGLQAGIVRPRLLPTLDGFGGESRRSDDLVADLLFGHTVVCKPIRWLWPSRFPLDCVCVMAGLQGQGKSLVTLDMASRISNGTLWPDGSGNAPKGSVLILNAEDAPDYVSVPRLTENGADLSKICFLRGIRNPDGSKSIFDLNHHVRHLEKACEKVGDVRLIVIDPIGSYMGDSDMYGDASTRHCLQPLADIAEKTGACVLIVAHLRKQSSDTVAAMLRVSGSVAFTAFPRSVWMIGRNMQEEFDDERLMMLPAKMNFAKPAPGLVFDIVDSNGMGVIRWGRDGINCHADNAFLLNGKNKVSPEAKEADEFLKQLLANGIEMNVSDIKAMAKKADITTHSLRKARERLIQTIKPEEFSGEYRWRLKTEEPEKQWWQ